jgi:hypothetical protein
MLVVIKSLLATNESAVYEGLTEYRRRDVDHGLTSTLLPTAAGAAIR